MKLSIIIPVYNEEKTVIEVLNRLKKENIPNVKKEIIVVDDGSTDMTLVKLKEYTEKNKEIKIISYVKNLGKGAAVKAGIKKSTGDYIIIQDADLEYHPKYIKELIDGLKKYNCEVIYGTRLKRPPHLGKEERTLQFLSHYIGNRFLSLLTSILYGQWITDMETGYKLFSKQAIKDIKLNARGFELEPEITSKFLKKGFRIKEILITANPRGYNEGKKIRAIRDGSIAFWTLLKYRFVD